MLVQPCNVFEAGAVLSSGKTNERGMEMEGILIPIVAIVLSIGGPITIVIVVLAMKHKEEQAKYETIRKAVEAGRPTAEVEQMLRASGATPPNPKKSLRTGIILCGIGLGTGLIALFAGEPEAYAGMGFLLALGFAFIVVWLLVDRNKRPADAA
jgi:hypothetical protein